MARMRGGEAVVASLQRHGVEVVFGLPGVQIMGLFDAFYGLSGPRLVTTRHEQGAGFMAYGYALSTGRPGVAAVVPGPGVLNAAAALGTAFSTCTPVLLIAGQIESAELGRGKGLLHEIEDQLAIFRNLTKWRHQVRRVEEIPEALTEAFFQMTSGRPGPAVVEIPPDLLLASGDISIGEPRPRRVVPPEAEALDRAAALLQQAQWPLLWVGGGAVAAEAGPALRRLVEQLQAPLITTPEGKGVLPESHPLSLGVGRWGHGAATLAVPRADVVLALGTRLTIAMQGPGALRPPQRLIQADVDPGVFGRNYPAEVSILGDARLVAEGLLARLTAQGHTAPQRAAEVAAIREELRRHINAAAPLQVELVAQLRDVLDQDAILVPDLTNLGYWAHLAFPVETPRCFLTSGYFGTLGYAFPTALGVKVAHPHRQVLALCGDGGFLYAASELATAMLYGINLVAVVFADGAYGASRNDQRLRFEGRYVGTGLRNPDFVRFAEAFGARGYRVSPEQLGEAVGAALAVSAPALIEVPIPTLDPPFQVRLG